MHRIRQIVLIPILFFPLMPILSFAGEVDLPKTGQETCSDIYGNVIPCQDTGQDGDIQAGVEWPVPRFEDNEDGTVTLGTADAGARITFTNVNAVDVTDKDWVLIQLNTVYHEFAHIVHQNFKLPPAFETISPTGYTSAGSWFVLSDDDALKRGFVSPYATSSPNEDFAETVANYLFDKDFYENFITIDNACTSAECEERNVGKTMISEKLNSIRSHYKKVTGVDLDELRESVQVRLK